MYNMKEPNDDVQSALEQMAERLHARVPGGLAFHLATYVHLIV